MKFVWFLVSVFLPGSFGHFDYRRDARAFENVLNLTELDVTAKCNESLTLYLEKLRIGDEDPWALRMFDATSKIPVGLFYSYNFGELGDFDECLATESRDGLIKAKYCLGSIVTLPIGNNSFINLRRDAPLFRQQMQLRETAMSLINIQEQLGDSASIAAPSWAICLPSDCTDEDVLEVLFNLIGSETALCQTQEDLNPPLTAKAIVAIVILLLFALTLVVSTAYDVYCKQHNTVPSSAILVAFSMYTNGKNLFRINRNPTELSCLNGIKCLSMFWVFVGHIFSTMTGTFPLSNYKDVLDWANSVGSMTFASGGLSVDTFLVASGTLIVYIFMKCRHNGINFNIVQFYVHRYLRLTPPFAAAVLVSGTLLEYMGSGPRWMFLKTAFQENCENYWWSALLYIQNYVNIGKFCVGQTWYLDIDTQLYVLAPLLLFPLWKYPKIGISLVVACIAASIAAPFYVAYHWELSGLLTNLYPKGPKDDYMNNYYLRTHTRAAPWFVGVLLGYILSVVKFQRNANGKLLKINLSKVIMILGWIICIAVMLTCVYGGHSTLRGPEYYRLANAFYIAFVRPAWSFGLAWVIFACVMGYGGPVNWILSFPHFQILNRFTYSLYILHVTILYMIGFSSKRSVYFSVLNGAYSFWGLYMFSFGLSLLWIFAFESPVIIIEKLIMNRSSKVTDTNGKTLKENAKNGSVP